jgi:hypothetical protein
MDSHFQHHRPGLGTISMADGIRGSDISTSAGRSKSTSPGSRKPASLSSSGLQMRTKEIPPDEPRLMALAKESNYDKLKARGG